MREMIAGILIYCVVVGLYLRLLPDGSRVRAHWDKRHYCSQCGRQADWCYSRDADGMGKTARVFYENARCPGCDAKMFPKEDTFAWENGCRIITETLRP